MGHCHEIVAAGIIQDLRSGAIPVVVPDPILGFVERPVVVHVYEHP